MEYGAKQIGKKLRIKYRLCSKAVLARETRKNCRLVKYAKITRNAEHEPWPKRIPQHVLSNWPNGINLKPQLKFIRSQNMICRLCSLEAPENPKAKPNAWNFGVCQACTKTTRLHHLTRIQYQRNTGREDETVMETCSYCSETKTVRAFAPSALANGMVGFPLTCSKCQYLRRKPDDFSDLV